MKNLIKKFEVLFIDYKESINWNFALRLIKLEKLNNLNVKLNY